MGYARICQPWLKSWLNVSFVPGVRINADTWGKDSAGLVFCFFQF